MTGNNITRALALAGIAAVAMAVSANAQNWVSIPMPTASGWGGTVLNSVGPFALGYPPVVGKNSHYESASVSNVKGISFRGDAIAIGSTTDQYNAVAFFFTDSQGYAGHEVGLIVEFDTGYMFLYQCGPQCNKTGQQWSQAQVWSTPKDYYNYEILFPSPGTNYFTFNVVTAFPPYQTIFSTTVNVESWNIGFYNTSGFVTITAQNHSSASMVGSVLHADEIDIGQ